MPLARLMCPLLRPAARAVFSLGVLSLVAPTLDAQATPPDEARGPVTAGVAFNVSQPRGAFDETTNLGYGLSGNVLLRLDESAILNLRTELGFITYGNVTQRVPLSATTGGLIQVDLRTTNNIATFLTGPQLLGPTGAFMPYAAALGGFSAFFTTSSVEGSDQQTPFASTTNSSDFAWVYGGAAGAYLRVANGDRPVRLELGVRYLRHDDVTYLTADEVRSAVRESRTPQAIRSRVDYYTYLIGVQMNVF